MKRLILPTLLLAALAGPVRASECGIEAQTLDREYNLAALEPVSGIVVAPPSSSGSGMPVIEPPSNTPRMATVPNTGGTTNPRNTTPAPLTDGQREDMRVAIRDAKRADDAGDGTLCAQKLAEARRIAQSDPSQTGTGNAPAPLLPR